MYGEGDDFPHSESFYHYLQAVRRGIFRFMRSFSIPFFNNVRYIRTEELYTAQNVFFLFISPPFSTQAFIDFSRNCRNLVEIGFSRNLVEIG